MFVVSVTVLQDIGDATSLLNLDPSEHTPEVWLIKFAAIIKSFICEVLANTFQIFCWVLILGYDYKHLVTQH